MIVLGAERVIVGVTIAPLNFNCIVLVTTVAVPSANSICSSGRGGTVERAGKRRSDVGVSDTTHKAALALMNEKGQSVDMRTKDFYANYRVALSDREASVAKQNEQKAKDTAKIAVDQMIGLGGNLHRMGRSSSLRG